MHRGRPVFKKMLDNCLMVTSDIKHVIPVHIMDKVEMAVEAKPYFDIRQRIVNNMYRTGASWIDMIKP